MLCSMAVVIRQLTKRYSTIYNLTFNRTIMTSASRAEKAVEVLKKNPYFEKYAQKIATLQQTSPEDFLSKIDAYEQVKNKPKQGAVKERQYSSLLKPKEATSSSGVADRSLKDIMKIELIKDKDADEIKHIWEQYHIQKDVIAATIPVKMYERIMSRSEQYPTFIFPLPRSEGYEFMVHKENAPECLTIVHYTEFKEDKKLILMRGEFDKDVIDAKEAQCLANQLQLYYGQDNEKKLSLLQTFTNKPDKFKHMDLISELENLSL